MKYLREFNENINYEKDFIDAIKSNDINLIKSLSGNVDINKLVLDPSTTGPVKRYYFTPLVYAVKSMRNINVIQCLLELGADFNIEDTDKMKPIHYAIKADRLNVFDLLLDKGYDIFDDNYLNLAAYWSSVRVAERMLKLGVDVGLKNVHGSIALKWASHKGYIEFVELLLIQPGTTVEHIDIAINAAKHQNKDNIVNLLELFRKLLNDARELDEEERKAVLTMT